MSTPVLWQYNFSNYNEKARWALDYKRLPHRRRSLMPGEPRAIAFSLRGTLPALDLEGRRIGDSREIIAALERIRPDPPLYPADPLLRRRALELEDLLTEHTGHEVRRTLFWALRGQRDYLLDFLAYGQPGAKRALLRMTFPIGWLYVSRRYAFNPDDVERSWTGLEATLDRIERERGGGDYLVGDGFSVADLTAAALLWPLAWPAELQYDYPRPPTIERWEQLRAHPAAAWVGEMYARHRGSSAEVETAEGDA